LPQLGDFLTRFRPAGAPGAASRVGVPADRAAELGAELDPVLALLADTQAQCAGIIAHAEREASRIADDAHARAARIAADAVARAQAARDDAAAQVLTAARKKAAADERAAADSARAEAGPGEAEIRALILAAVELVKSMPDGGEGR
jgi:hypothetical protein